MTTGDELPIEPPFQVLPEAEHFGVDQRAIAGIYAKIQRAQVNLADLKPELDAFTQRQPYSVTGKFNDNRTEYVYTANPLELPSPAWGVRYGEIYHHLRSALDHCVYQLTIDRNGTPKSGTGFPIFTDEDKFYEKRSTGKPKFGSGEYQIRGIGPRPANRIRECQPYHADRPDDTLLATLQAAWNKEKHRVIPLGVAMAVSATVRGENVTEVGELTTLSRIMHGDTEIAKVSFTTPQPPEARIRLDLTAKITIDEPDLDSSVDFTMEDLFTEVTTIVSELLTYIGAQGPDL